MRPFVYESPSSPQQAISRGGADSAFIAGGTTLIDLMKLEVMKPSRVVDLNPLQLRGIEMLEDGFADRCSGKNERRRSLILRSPRIIR